MVSLWYPSCMKKIEAQCYRCKKTVVLETKSRKETYRRSGRTFCSDECQKITRSKESSERMSRTNRKHASERMKRKNPMHDPEVRERMASTLKSIGHKPKTRGGNGSPIPEPQRILAEALGSEWLTEHSVGISDGAYPRVYHLDIAHVPTKTCVEVDGGSHCSLERQASDLRRDERLSSEGWTVLRFSNQAAMERTEECVQMVLSTTSK